MRKRIYEDDFDREDSDYITPADKAKILVFVIPAALIVIILAVTLIVNSASGKKKDDKGTEDLQQSIMDYADESRPVDSSQVKEPEQPEEAAGKQDVKEPGREDVTEEAEKEEKSGESAPTPYQQVMDTDKVDYSKVSYNREEQLKEMMTYWADNNQHALDDLANLDRFKAMSWALKGTKDFYYYGDRNAAGAPEGKGIAVYADNQYYYGDWRGGVRSGKGTWIHYHIHNNANTNDICLYHQYTGSWAGDLPDGEGSEHYDYDEEKLKKNSCYDTNLIGSYSKGLVNGEFYLTSLYYDKSIREWDAQADHGSWIYQNDNKDTAGRKPVYVSTTDPDNYFWMLPKENKNIGVPCLVSSEAASVKN